MNHQSHGARYHGHSSHQHAAQRVDISEEPLTRSQKRDDYVVDVAIQCR